MVSCVSAVSITHSVAMVGNTSAETWKRHISATFSCVSANVNSDLRLRKHMFPLAEIWRKHEQKVVRFRCIRSNGNASKRHETANGNTGYPSCFRNGFTCFCDVSVYGFLKFRPVRGPDWLSTIGTQSLKLLRLGSLCISAKSCNCDSLVIAIIF